MVDDSLKIKNLENVFATGDNLEFIDSRTQKPIPAMAYVAEDQGRVVAKNILKLIDGKSSRLDVYKPFYSVWVVPIGGKYAVAHLTSSITVKGFLAWLIRELISIKYFISILSFQKALKLYWEEVTVFTKND